MHISFFLWEGNGIERWACKDRLLIDIKCSDQLTE